MLVAENNAQSVNSPRLLASIDPTKLRGPETDVDDDKGPGLFRHPPTRVDTLITSDAQLHVFYIPSTANIVADRISHIKFIEALAAIPELVIDTFELPPVRPGRLL